MAEHPEQAMVAQRIAQDLIGRHHRAARTGAGLSDARAQHAHAFARRTAAAAAGHASPLQSVRRRLRARRTFGRAASGRHRSAAASPSIGSRPSGNSLFVVEHDLDVIRHADWIVDVGPAAGEQGGEILYSGPPAGLRKVERIADPRVISSAAICRRAAARRARPTAGSAGAESRAIISTSSMPLFRWAFSPP